ncbi:MAG TPA: hypothetical protein VNN98_05230, partial [Rhizomicrobium sp.]|nr:hypothetical protein [Rhizomicrobium sp.]
MKPIFVAAIVVGISCFTGPSIQAANQARHPSSGSYLTLEKEYNTKCMRPYDGDYPFGGGLVEGAFLYSADQSHYFTKLDLLTGECAKAASVPSSMFDPKAISSKYLVAEDGVSSRYSAYLKSDWSRKGSL